MTAANGATPGWRPPPECLGCDRPMRNRVHRRQGGYCRTCRPLTASPVQALPNAGRIDLAEWQQLAQRRGAEDRRQAAERDARRRRRRG